MLLELLSGRALDNPHLNVDWSQEIMPAPFRKNFKGHATTASHSKFTESLDEVFDGLSFFLLGEKESVHVDIHFFLEEAAQEEGFQVVPTRDGPLCQLAEPFKSYPLEGANEQSSSHRVVPY